VLNFSDFVCKENTLEFEDMIEDKITKIWSTFDCKDVVERNHLIEEQIDNLKIRTSTKDVLVFES
jgi:Ni2+-binding GTPase involved in maturation of urease and hydrogenase